MYVFLKCFLGLSLFCFVSCGALCEDWISVSSISSSLYLQICSLLSSGDEDDPLVVFQEVYLS